MYAVMPPELRQEVIANLSLGDAINYCLLGETWREEVRSCHPFWRRVAYCLQRLTTDLIYNFGSVHVPVSLLRLQCVDTIRSLSFETIRELDDPRIINREPVTERPFPVVVEHIAVDYLRDLLAVCLRDNSVQIYPLSRVSYCDPIYTFTMNQRWIVRQMHICNGSAIFEVGYWLVPVQQPHDFALRFLTFDGTTYGGVLNDTTFLGRTAVNDNYIVSCVSGMWSGDIFRSAAFAPRRRLVIVPRNGSRYSSTYAIYDVVGRGCEIALDGTQLGVLDYIVRPGPRRRYRLNRYDIGDPALPLIAVNGEAQLTLIGSCRITLREPMFDRGFHLQTAHRFSSFYGRTTAGEVGLNFIRHGNFVASCCHYGKLYFAKLCTDQCSVDIVKVGLGEGEIVERFGGEAIAGSVNDLCFLHLSRPSHYFAGRNLIYVWMRSLYVRQVHD